MVCEEVGQPVAATALGPTLLESGSAAGQFWQSIRNDIAAAKRFLFAGFAVVIVIAARNAR
jgi:hypothetical protein